MSNILELSPSQRAAADELLAGMRAGRVLLLRTRCGMGRSTILEWLRAQTGGALLGARDFTGALLSRRPEAMEEALFELIEAALKDHEVAIVDDLHLLAKVADGLAYPRAYLLDVALAAIADEAARRGKRLVLGVDPESIPWTVRSRGRLYDVQDFTVQDFEFFCRAFLGSEAAPDVDCAKIHRFAPALTARQMEDVCAWLRQEATHDTERAIGYLRSQDLAGNVDLDEVPAVDWKDLSGVDEVIRALEAKVALPFEDDQLAVELKLKPKRGVLLAGPPGTGKTTIGRALARRLESKFFLIDGTTISGSCDFYQAVDRVFDAAKRNAPAVVFIDDADVIFEGEDRGFYRYLLTMLDGLESTSAERVCVMMTAMNAGSLPAAILRSGRIELWLEMRLPDEQARAEILRRRFEGLPQPVAGTDVDALASASRGLTGADLKAVVEDGKLLFAHDRARGRVPRPVEEYFLDAIETVRENRRNYSRPQRDPLLREARIGFTAD